MLSIVDPFKSTFMSVYNSAYGSSFHLSLGAYTLVLVSCYACIFCLITWDFGVFYNSNQDNLIVETLGSTNLVFHASFKLKLLKGLK